MRATDSVSAFETVLPSWLNFTSFPCARMSGSSPIRKDFFFFFLSPHCRFRKRKKRSRKNMSIRSCRFATLDRLNSRLKRGRKETTSLSDSMPFLPSTLCVPHKHSREIPFMPNDEVDEVTVKVELPTIVRLLRSSSIWWNFSTFFSLSGDVLDALMSISKSANWIK